MRHRIIILNAIAAVAQVIILGISLFVLYKLLLKWIGVERLGLWSVVMATTSLSNLANLGLSNSVVKYVAQYKARNDELSASRVVQTTALSLGLIFAIFGLIMLYVAKSILAIILPVSYLVEGLTLVPYSIVSIWFLVVSGVFQSGIDGCQRIYYKVALVLSATIVYFIACLLLVPRFGIMGLAYAQVLQTGLLFVGSWLILRRLMPLLPIIPIDWNKRLFKEMLVYGVNFQIMNITSLLYDPITKALLTRFGGLSITGYYEMASRLIQQVRSIITSANQVLVPTIADAHEREPKLIKAIYNNSYQFVWLAAFPFFSALVALSPIIAKLWIGDYKTDFIFISLVLSFGWLVNTLAVPAYFVFAGIGILRWNTIGQVAIAILNLCLGFFLGWALEGRGVVIAWGIALVFGSCIVPIAYHLKTRISLAELVPRSGLVGAVGSGLAAIISLPVSYSLRGKVSVELLSISVLTFLTLIYVICFWKNTTLNKTLSWVTQEFLPQRFWVRQK